MSELNILWFKNTSKEDTHLVGEKGASLGEMVKAGLPVPDGFSITSNAYNRFIRENNLDTKIKHLITTINFNNPNSLNQVSSIIKSHITRAELSSELKIEIYNAYKKLGGLQDAFVAIRFSSTADDIPNTFYTGSEESYLNVRGETNVIEKIRECWASHFDAKALSYRHNNKFENRKIGISIVVQKMVESDKSGIMITINPVTNDKNKMIIESVWGLGEILTDGKALPDHYEIDKTSLKLLTKEISVQTSMIKKASLGNKTVRVPLLSRKKQKVSDKHILELAKLGKKLEKHYFFPQNCEWAIENGEIYLLETKPITLEPKIEIKPKLEEGSIFGKPILTGSGISSGIISGNVKVISDLKKINELKNKEILVAPFISPMYLPILKKAGAVISESGGKTSHMSIISRELGIPGVVGVKNATKKLKTGSVITVNGATGEIFAGSRVTTNQKVIKEEYAKTATKVYVNLSEPELAEPMSARNIDGVGLLRSEFMMSKIKIHPKKVIRDGKSKDYIEKLAENMEKFCNAFYPRPILYRTSDFKSNEYRNLDGGREFEPIEQNPMLGFRGAYRYIHDPEIFRLEIEAIKHVRNKKNFKNLWIMLPFVRNPKELELTKKILSKHGLTRSPSLKIWMMVETPANVIALEDFIKLGIDGVSIGTNDLTSLMLGVDRESAEVASEYNERDKVVLWAIEEVIKTAHKNKINSSICGQAATYPEVLELVVRAGVTSVSVSPDSIDHTRNLISEIERKAFSGRV